MAQLFPPSVDLYAKIVILGVGVCHGRDGYGEGMIVPVYPH